MFSLLNLNLLADDTNLLFADYMSHKDIDALEDIISNEFMHVSDWLIGNGLTLSTNKSKHQIQTEKYTKRDTAMHKR